MSRRQKLWSEHLEESAENLSLSQSEIGGAAQDRGCLAEDEGQ